MKTVRWKQRIVYLGVSALMVLTVLACETYYFRSHYSDINIFLHHAERQEQKPYLKAHLKNGDVCILMDQWEIDSAQTFLTGTGSRFDAYRAGIYAGEMSISIDSIAILETNKKLKGAGDERVAILAILAGIDAGITVFCIANPKACWGSCPTFYLNADENLHFADAEGFTHAVSPSLEYHDIDALNNNTISGSDFFLTMKNEAMETHCVKSVKLFAYPRRKGERVYQTREDVFYACENRYPLTKATAPEGDVTIALVDGDREERFSLADEHDLCSRETVYLAYDNITQSENLGLVISYRQTLMSTYLFYTAMDYMGDEVSDVFALLETDAKMRKNFDTTTKVLGEIDVYLWDEDRRKWIFQGGIHESGPIAFNHQILPLNTDGAKRNLRLKLVMNRGLWRIDQVALTNITREVRPEVLDPHGVTNKGTADPSALARIHDPDAYLLSMPGSAYTFTFHLPDVEMDYELFLYSEGYYLEWMRTEWMQEKNLIKLKQMVEYPRSYLRGEAAAYKEYETTMERMFWNSRIDTKAYSYYEN